MHLTQRKTGASLFGTLITILLLSFALVRITAPPAAAAASGPLQIDMKVLVVATAASGGPTQPYEDLMARDGTPFTKVTVAEANSQVNAGFLAATPAGGTPIAKFQGVILPDAKWTGLNAGAQAALKAYMTTYGIRQLSAVVNPDSTIAMNPGVEQSMDGLVATVTPDARAATGPFNYLAGPVPFVNVDNSWEYSGWPTAPLAAPAAGTSMTPLVTMPDNKILVGVYQEPGVENMIVAFNGNSGQTPFRLLGPGILNWLTQGTHLGLNRNYLSVHADDVLNADARWDVNQNCTPGEDGVNAKTGAACTEPTTPNDILMTPADVTALTNWQNATALKIDMAYNAAPSDVRGGSADPLTASLLAAKSQLRWINHTYNHLYLGCAQQPTAPYNCQENPASTWVDAETIREDIQENIDWATTNEVAIDPTEMISGEHSGLADGNPGRVQGDNPNFVSTINALGIKVTGSDNSKGSTPRTLGASAKTLPRYPNSIYYNVATKAESVDEYNWIYGPSSDPQGNCVATPVTTCMTAVLGADGYDTYIAPFEARQTLERVLNNDPRPHYTHQSNLAETSTGGGLVTTWLDLVLDGNGAGTSGTILGYKDVMNANTPIINPTMTESSLTLEQQASWNAAKDNVAAYIKNGQTVITNGTASAVWVPLSAATGLVDGSQTAWGETYGGTRSQWTRLAAGASLKVDVAPNVAPVASFTTACTQLSCTFTSTSTDVDSEVGSLKYEWTFGDGTPVPPANEPTATHTYVADGTYTVTLKVTDLRNASHTATGTVSPAGLPNVMPVAVAKLTAPCTGLACSFDGTGSTDADGTIASYAWNFGDGATSTEASPKHTYPSVGGTFTATLTVTDNRQGVSAPVSLPVTVVAPPANEAPTAAFTVTCIGLTCGANASASTDPDGNIQSYQWTFGDGTTATGVNPLGHVYPRAGSYTITLTVTDNGGAIGSRSQTVAVLPSPTIKVGAVLSNGSLQVDVDPNLTGTGYWEFKVQSQRADATWGDLATTYRTEGNQETRTINLAKGTYRVMTLPRTGYGSGVSSPVVLQR